MSRGTQHRCQRSLAYFVLPAILLVLGLPIFLVLLVTCLVVVLFVADVPTEAVQTYLFGGLDNFPLLAVPFFVLAGEIMAQGGIARRVVVWVISLIGGVRGSLGGDDGRGLRAVRRDGAHRRRHGRRGRPHDLSVAPGERLQRALRGRPDRVVGRHRRGDPAVDRDDPLLGVGAAVGGRAVHRRHPAEPADRPRRRALRDDLRPHQDGAAHRAGALGRDLGVDQGGELVDRHHRGDLRRHLWRRLHADRGRRRRGDLFAVRDHGGAPRGRTCAISGASSRARCS